MSLCSGGRAALIAFCVREDEEKKKLHERGRKKTSETQEERNEGEGERNVGNNMFKAGEIKFSISAPTHTHGH